MQPRATLSINPVEYREFQEFLQQACGILLGSGKEYLVSSRLSALLAEQDIDGLGGLLRTLKAPGGQGLKVRVIDAMTTNETFWYRDVSHFELLRQKIFPELEKRPGGAMRIWSAACSSGQEPYNLSMTVEEYLGASRNGYNRSVEILATDISTRMLEQARSGIYCGVAADRGLTSEQSRRFFVPKRDCLEVLPEIRRRVHFRELNLTSSFAVLGRFDVIFCRNVLIYFSHDLKRDIINRMAQVLNPGGYLFLGSTESINQLSDRFEMRVDSGGIAYRLKD
ncbi:MAG: CheR family methyltransferase [Gammaproteobacteria bacterium]|nr:CheR family methyltransferase [Gammaproteobacteria bacterium]